jgi:hypothetical protein
MVPEHEKTPKGAMYSLEKGLLTPAAMAHLSALNIVHPSHQFIQPVEQTIQQQKKKSGDVARRIVMNFFQLSLYRISCCLRSDPSLPLELDELHGRLIS